jgi:hypothetical protein
MTIAERIEPEFDALKAEAVAGRLVGALNDSALMVMTSVGHRAGLFDALGSLPPRASGRSLPALNTEFLHRRVVGSQLVRDEARTAMCMASLS